MNILIRGGQLIDPANSINSIQDVYISYGKIVAPSESFVPDEIIDASGKIVCPGFIDIHMHEDPIDSDGQLYKDREKAIFNCMLRQGVTSAIGGNCGENKYHPADYLDIVDSQGAAVNVGMMAGHEYLRHMVGAMDKYGPVSESQLQRMSAEAESCLIRGCVGISFGIRYIPGIDMHELLRTAEGCKRHGGRISAHIRSDAEEVFDAAREFLDAGLELNVPVQLSHMGHPIRWDMRYGHGEKGRDIALWGAVLNIAHPTKKDPMVFTSFPHSQAFLPWKPQIDAFLSSLNPTPPSTSKEQ